MSDVDAITVLGVPCVREGTSTHHIGKLVKAAVGGGS